MLVIYQNRKKKISDDALPHLVSARRLSDLSSQIIYSAQSLADSDTEIERLKYGRYLSASGKVMAKLLSSFSNKPVINDDSETLRLMTNQIIDNLARMGEKVGERIELQSKLLSRYESLSLAANELTQIVRTLVANADTTVVANLSLLYDLAREQNNEEQLYQSLDQLLEVDADHFQRMVVLELRAHQLKNVVSQLESSETEKELKQQITNYQQAMKGIHHLITGVDDPQRKQRFEPANIHTVWNGTSSERHSIFDQGA